MNLHLRVMMKRQPAEKRYIYRPGVQPYLKQRPQGHPSASPQSVHPRKLFARLNRDQLVSNPTNPLLCH